MDAEGKPFTYLKKGIEEELKRLCEIERMPFRQGFMQKCGNPLCKITGDDEYRPEFITDGRTGLAFPAPREMGGKPFCWCCCSCSRSWLRPQSSWSSQQPELNVQQIGKWG